MPAAKQLWYDFHGFTLDISIMFRNYPHSSSHHKQLSDMHFHLHMLNECKNIISYGTPKKTKSSREKEFLHHWRTVSEKQLLNKNICHYCLKVSKRQQPVFVTPMLIQQVFVVCSNCNCNTFDHSHETSQCQLVLYMQFNRIKPQGGMLKRFKGCIIALQNCKLYKPN